MNDTKSLTLDEVRLIIEGHKENRSTPAEAMQFDYVLSLLARVEQPSEEDMAVLWLMKRDDYDVCCERDHYAVYRRVDEEDNAWCWVSDSPAEEARKLGWEG